MPMALSSFPFKLEYSFGHFSNPNLYKLNPPQISQENPNSETLAHLSFPILLSLEILILNPSYKEE